MPQTGPVSKVGKRHASLNSVKHGLNSSGFLPCKRQQCFYWPGCPCRDANGCLPDEILYGAKCPAEIAAYQVLVEQYGKALGSTGANRNEEVQQLAMSELRLMRSRAAAAIDAIPTRRIPSAIPGYDRPAPALQFRYHYELTKNFFGLLSKSFPYIAAYI